MKTRKARKTDPITSHLAAASATEESLTRIEKYVYQIFSTGLHLLDEELVQIFTGNGYPGSPQGIRTARAELARMGKLKEIGIGKTKYGRKARVWCIN